MAHITSIPVFADATARDAIVGYEDGDMAYLTGVGLTVYRGSAWVAIASSAGIAGLPTADPLVAGALYSNGVPSANTPKAVFVSGG